MTSSVSDIRSYTFAKGDQVFLDANIWLFIDGPVWHHPDRRSKIYSAAFKKMRETGTTIYIDVLVLSEFINRYARLLYGQQAAKPPKFKDWRKTSDFKTAAQEIGTQAKKVASKCRHIDSGFELADIEAILKDFSTGNSDFNDQVIAELCKRENLALITNDADFRATGLRILTANRRLLEA